MTIDASTDPPELQRRKALDAATKQAFSRTREGVVVMDRTLRVIMTNQAAHRIMPMGISQGKYIDERWPKEAGGGSIRTLIRYALSRQEGLRFELPITHSSPLSYLCVRVFSDPDTVSIYFRRFQRDDHGFAEDFGDEACFVPFSEVEAKQPDFRDAKSVARAMETCIQGLRNHLRNVGDARKQIRRLASEGVPEELQLAFQKHDLAAEVLDQALADLKVHLDLVNYQPKCAETDVSKVAHEAGIGAQSFDGKFPSKIVVQPDMWALADRHLLYVIYRALLSNALKYSPEGGDIRVGAVQDGSHTLYFVADEGVGIKVPNEEIFRPFSRLARSEWIFGTGMGLANVDAAVRRMNGRVWVESEVGKGSTFYFTLGES